MQIDPDLAEWDYGDYEGLHSAEIGELRPDWNIFRDGCPNGESPAQVGGRADRLIARLRAQGGNIGLFSHGQFGCVLAARWIGLPVPQACHFTLGTASLSVLGYDPRHAEVPVIASWNAAPWELFDLQGSPREHLANAMRRRAIERWESEGGKIFPAPQARR
jgi:probable phosphoglycerate mutase